MVNSCKKICPAALGTLGGTPEDVTELGRTFDRTLGRSAVLGGHDSHEEAEDEDDESLGDHILSRNE